jgi:hypothetical protein
MGADCRPLVIENAVVNRITKSPGVREGMSSKNPFLHCTKSKNGVSRFFVENVGLDLDANTFPFVERVTKHQIFRFGIDVGSLK